MTVSNRDSEIAVNGFCQAMQLSLEIKISFTISHDKAKHEWSMLLRILNVLRQLLSKQLSIVVFSHSDQSAIHGECREVLFAVSIVNGISTRKRDER